MVKQRTIFLGAGASIDAGYPSTSDLYDRLNQYYSDICNNIQKEEWKEFKKYRNRAKGSMGSILKSSNLELVLTFPDLLATALKEYDSSTYSQIKTKNPLEGAKEWSERTCSTEREKLQKAENIRNLFLRLLEHFFNYYSFEDSNRILPPYYKNMLHGFDNIITTNWDSLSERTLLNCSQWNPFDGYGVELSDEDKGSPTSRKMIYKLHGSVGWRFDNQSGTFFLDSTFKKYLLNHHSFTTDRRGWPGNSKHIFITPSYLKQLDNQYLIEIWQKAYKTICNSSKLCIVGYSLPRADVAIRALLLAAFGKEIEVIDPCFDNKKNWDKFLGSGNYTFIERTAGEYFCKDNLEYKGD